jgi:hypothetical protein
MGLLASLCQLFDIVTRGKLSVYRFSQKANQGSRSSPDHDGAWPIRQVGQTLAQPMTTESMEWSPGSAAPVESRLSVELPGFV